MAGIYVSEDTRCRVIFPVEERYKEVSWRGVIKQLIDVSYESGKARMWMQSLRSKGALKASHEQRRSYTFSGNISDSDAPTPSLQGQEVVVIASDVLSGLVKSLAG